MPLDSHCHATKATDSQARRCSGQGAYGPLSKKKKQRERERESERKKERAREREVGCVRAYVYVLQRLLWLRSESQRTFRGSGMFEVALETLRFVHQRLTSNWWGLGCPVHCRGTDFGSLLASFLLGFLTPSALGGLDFPF